MAALVSGILNYNFGLLLWDNFEGKTDKELDRKKTSCIFDGGIGTISSHPYSASPTHQI